MLDCYSSFSPELGALAKRFFDERYIDAPVRPAKRGGAFCASAVPSAHPYVLLNYTSRRRDVLTLAHELGHGVHFALAARQGVFHQGTPLTLAETASVFAETVVFGRLLAEDSSPASRLALLAENLEDTIATVFRQVAMNRFEDLVHTARRERGELSVERFGELWAESQSELLGDSVEITDGYRSWWSYIPHFIGSPGYVYAYAYGQLLALSVYERYEQRAPELVPPLPGAARRRRLEKPRGARSKSSASTSPTRVSGRPGWTWSSASCMRPNRRPRSRCRAYATTSETAMLGSSLRLCRLSAIVSEIFCGTLMSSGLGSSRAASSPTNSSRNEYEALRTSSKSMITVSPGASPASNSSRIALPRARVNRTRPWSAKRNTITVLLLFGLRRFGDQAYPKLRPNESRS